MKMIFSGTCLAAFAALAISASAQQPTPTTPAPQPTTPAPSASVKLDKDTKLTGCLKAGADAGSFELANVKKEGASASMAAKDAKNVRLSPASGVDLAAHVGHTVELSGTWSAGASASTSPSATAPAADAKAAKAFSVTDVKMVSATCTTGTN